MFHLFYEDDNRRNFKFKRIVCAFLCRLPWRPLQVSVVRDIHDGPEEIVRETGESANHATHALCAKRNGFDSEVDVLLGACSFHCRFHWLKMFQGISRICAKPKSRRQDPHREGRASAHKSGRQHLRRPTPLCPNRWEALRGATEPADSLAVPSSCTNGADWDHGASRAKSVRRNGRSKHRRRRRPWASGWCGRRCSVRKDVT